MNLNHNITQFIQETAFIVGVLSMFVIGYTQSKINNRKKQYKTSTTNQDSVLFWGWMIFFLASAIFISLLFSQ